MNEPVAPAPVTVRITTFLPDENIEQVFKNMVADKEYWMEKAKIAEAARDRNASLAEAAHNGRIKAEKELAAEKAKQPAFWLEVSELMQFLSGARCVVTSTGKLHLTDAAREHLDGWKAAANKYSALKSILKGIIE